MAGRNITPQADLSALVPGVRVRAHANLQAGRMTVTPPGGGGVLQYEDTLIELSDAVFTVSAPGHKRIVEQQRRKVVADVRGMVRRAQRITVDIFEGNPDYIPVSYNPVKHPDRDYFYLPDGAPVQRVQRVQRVYVISSKSIPTKSRTRAYIRATNQ